MDTINNSEKSKKSSHHSNEIWVLDFTEESASEFRESILEESKIDPNKPIIVYIDSYGGQVDALAKMIATLDEVPNPIVTACYGKAMSCGAILLSHGDVRFCDPHSRVMIHKVSGIAHGDTEDITNDSIEIARLNEYWLGLLAQNCDIKGGYKTLESLLKSKDGRDRYYTAKQALDFGIVDIIGRPKILSGTVYEVSKAPEKISAKTRSKLRIQYKESKRTEKKSNVKSRRKSRKAKKHV